MLNEADAWLRLSVAFLHYKRISGVIDDKKLGVIYQLGICNAIDVLFQNELISKSIRNTMKRKVQRYGRKHKTYQHKMGLLYWPFTREGDAERALFCFRRIIWK